MVSRKENEIKAIHFFIQFFSFHLIRCFDTLLQPKVIKKLKCSPVFHLTSPYISDLFFSRKAECRKGNKETSNYFLYLKVSSSYMFKVQ